MLAKGLLLLGNNVAERRRFTRFGQVLPRRAVLAEALPPSVRPHVGVLTTEPALMKVSISAYSFVLFLVSFLKYVLLTSTFFSKTFPKIIDPLPTVTRQPACKTEARSKCTLAALRPLRIHCRGQSSSTASENYLGL